MTKSFSFPAFLALVALWPSLVASSQEVRNTAVTNSSIWRLSIRSFTSAARLSCVGVRCKSGVMESSVDGSVQKSSWCINRHSRR